MFGKSSITLESLKSLLSHFSSSQGLELYLDIKENAVEQIPKGLYIFKDSKLVQLTKEPVIKEHSHGAVNRPLFNSCGITALFLSPTSPSSPLLHMKSGYISQKWVSIATDLKINICPIGGLDIVDIKKILGTNTSYIHALLIGSQATESSIEQVKPTKVTSEDIKKFLQQKIPDYMVPTYCLILDKLPLTKNGKVDRTAVASLIANSAQYQSNAIVLPKTQFEKMLCGIYEKVLGMCFFNNSFLIWKVLQEWEFMINMKKLLPN